MAATYVGRACKYGHSGLRYRAYGVCVECAKRNNASDYTKQAQREFKGSSSGRYSVYKCKSRARKISFTITKEEFADILTDPCYWCGGAGIGINRVDNNLGYIPENCVSSCRFCNVAKNNYSVEEFLQYIRRIFRLHCES